uniref:Uncharacterized protein n=1 Tax=Panagrolaimus davidi TaxID=227884 RepID=A0A914PWM4_9BILA
MENSNPSLPLEIRRESQHFGYFSNLPMYPQDDHNERHITVHTFNDDCSPANHIQENIESHETKVVGQVLATI